MLSLKVYKNNTISAIVFTVKMCGKKAILISIVITSSIISIQSQTIIFPGPEVIDPFKDNPKWRDFQLTQWSRIETLKTLVNNTWKLIDSIPFPSLKSKTRESFVRFHVPEFLNFFNDFNTVLRNENPFPLVNSALGVHDISSFQSVHEEAGNNALAQLRLKWLEVNEMAQVIHHRFNKITEAILKDEIGIETMLFASEGEQITLRNRNSRNSSKGKTLKELAAVIDQQIIGNHIDNHLMRELVLILQGMKQSFVDTKEHLNYFCYGNNEFGVIPGLFDIVPNAGLYLIMADMKKLILDVYLLTYNFFFNNDKTSVKIEDMKVQRDAIMKEMLKRIERKINFPFLEGTGWADTEGKVIFKCDAPPNDLQGNVGQWGRNITTGVKPKASRTYVNSPPAGPLKENLTVGYLDVRSPILNSVGFDGAFQGYIESELALNPSSSCRETCPVFKRMTKVCDVTSKHCSLLRRSHCQAGNLSGDCMERNDCPSYAVKCQRTGREVRMCPSLDLKKRYDWISFNGRVLRRNNRLDGHNYSDLNDGPLSCPGGNVKIAMERWSLENGIILNTPRYCELCICTCMTPMDPTDKQYFDSRPVISDTSNGMIITAVRFSKENQVIRLAVEEGKATVDGKIEEKTLKWIVPEPILENHTNDHIIPFGLSGFMRFNFDLVLGKIGTVVTGVRFKFDKLSKSVGIEVQVTPITWPDEDSPKIVLDASAAEWLTPAESNAREPLKFVNPGDPASQRGPSMPDSVVNSYVEFTTSSYEADLAQTVIPAFDTQPVYHYEGRRWLRGVGIMHKGKPGSGGFIAPMIVAATSFSAEHYYPTHQRLANKKII